MSIVKDWFDYRLDMSIVKDWFKFDYRLINVYCYGLVCL